MRALVFTLTAALLAAPAVAQDAPQMRVSYADLDLTTAAGAARLDRRIEAAADAMCRAGDGRDLVMNMKARACAKAAIASAEAPVREALAAARSERQLASLKDTAAN
jgi:UrcA family protein